MKLRSIPPRTYLSLMRPRYKIRKVVKYDFVTGSKGNQPKREIMGRPLVDVPLTISRGKMRPQISRKPYLERLAALQSDLSELPQLAIGFDISKLEKELKMQIERLLQFLGLLGPGGEF